ncbi:MAG: DPP IV N-terminal domain-containing protein [Gemmatimonadales bacterium]
MRRCSALAAVAALFGTPLAAQGTRADYLRAERFQAGNATSLVAHDQVVPHWLDGNRFWYEDRTESGRRWLLIDAALDSERPVFDRDRLAAALTAATDTAIDPVKLRLPGLEVASDLAWIRFQRGTAHWRCALPAYTCTAADTTGMVMSYEVGSPDGAWAAYEESGNLYVRSLTSGERRQLTKDGTSDFGFAVNRDVTSQVTQQRFKIRRPPIVAWSPDSKRIVTHRVDERGVLPLAVIEPKPGRPTLHVFPYAMAGDSVLPRLDYHIVDLESGAVTRVDLPTHDADILLFATDTSVQRVRWRRDGARFFLVYGDRGDKRYRVVDVDAAIGRPRTVLTEARPTHVDLHPFIGQAAWRLIGPGADLVWYAERDGWAHFYRIDPATGGVRNRLTSGPWNVSEVEWIDSTGTSLFFTGRGREPGHPIHRRLYRVGGDGSGLTLLTPESGDHEVSFSPSGRYFVDRYSAMDAAPVTLLRDRSGKVIREVARANLSRLAALGWPMPIPFTVTARDGVTTLFGAIYRPSTFDSTRSYPILDYIYPGPQIGPLGVHDFSVVGGGGAQATAELGFIVMAIDALGTPFRSKAFHDSYYGNMGDNGIADHVAAIRQLAARHSWIDAERVGIFGHSGGGYSSARAILMYPDVFKVAASSAGNFDQRGYTFLWGEKFHGLYSKTADGTDSYANQDVQSLAKNLKGKLMLAYGEMDDNVPPNLTLVLIDALIKANKSFDLVVMPYGNHGFVLEPYFVRRRWDFLVRSLLGVEPPADFELTVVPEQ